MKYLRNHKKCSFYRRSVWLAASILTVINLPAASFSTLTIEPVTVYTGSSGEAGIALSGDSPASLEWTLSLPSTGLSGFDVVAGPALTAAGKTLSCAGRGQQLKCVASGMNSDPIANGMLAYVQFSADPAGAATPATSQIALEVATAVASSPDGDGMPSSVNGGVVTVLRRETLSLSPASATLAAGETAQFTSSRSAIWTVSPNVGAISAGGLYTAPALVSANQTVRITAVDAADSLQTATATVTLIATSISVSPTPVTVGVSGTRQFTARVLNAPDPGVTWSVSPSGGSITTNGLYTAPTAIMTPATVTVRATCLHDPSKSATAMVTLQPAITISINPPSGTLAASASMQFTAGVSGPSNTAVTWSITPTVGSISSAGLYRSPSVITASTTVQVKAASVADPGRYATATVTLQPSAPPANPGSTPNGLVAAYGFEEGRGTTTADASGNRNNGSIGRAAWTTSGKFGNALNFNGYNAMVSIADAPSLDLANGMTLEAWVKPSRTGDWRSVILKESPDDLSYGLYSNDDGTRPGVWVRSGSQTSFTRGAPLPLHTWTHMAATFDGSRLRFYMNGVLKSTISISHKIERSDNPLRLGGNTVWGEWFSGSIDEVRIYNRALSSNEIQVDMNRPVNPRI